MSPGVGCRGSAAVAHSSHTSSVRVRQGKRANLVSVRVPWLIACTGTSRRNRQQIPSACGSCVALEAEKNLPLVLLRLSRILVGAYNSPLCLPCVSEQQGESTTDLWRLILSWSVSASLGSSTIWWASMFRVFFLRAGVKKESAYLCNMPKAGVGAKKYSIPCVANYFQTLKRGRERAITCGWRLMADYILREAARLHVQHRFVFSPYRPFVFSQRTCFVLTCTQHAGLPSSCRLAGVATQRSPCDSRELSSPNYTRRAVGRRRARGVTCQPTARRTDFGWTYRRSSEARRNHERGE